MDTELKMNMLHLGKQGDVQVGQKQRPSSPQLFQSLKQILRLHTYPENEIRHFYPLYSQIEKHPEMSLLSDRIETLKTRKNYFAPLNIRKLARDGFYYELSEDGSHSIDTVRCFYCGVGLQDWAGVGPDMITKTHAKFSPHCGHLQHTMQQDVLNVYKAENPYFLQADGLAPPHLREGVFVSIRYFCCAVRRRSFPQIIDQAAISALAGRGFFYRGAKLVCAVCNKTSSMRSGEFPSHESWCNRPADA